MTTLCEKLLTIIDNHPTFDVTARELIQNQIEMWPQFPADQRPGFDCVELVWARERRYSSMAQPSDVGAVLLALFTDGGIDPFHGLTPDNIKEHILTSCRPSSAWLRSSLRDREKIVVANTVGGHGVSSSTFLRAITLGFAWDEEIPGQETMQTLAEGASPQHLMDGYRFSTKLARVNTGESRSPTATNDLERSRRVADGIIECLRSRVALKTMAGHAQESEAQRGIRVIELERVVRGMVELLSSTPAVSMPDLHRWFAPQIKDGPLTHLRRYVALGEPLMALVGNAADADVRRELESIMNVPSINGIPGFPSVDTTSRRPSDLLRRLRFLVYEIIRRAGSKNAGEMFHQFRFGFFDGSKDDLMLAAAKLAFTRPGETDPLLVRAELENLVERSGVRNGEKGNVHMHSCLRELRQVAVIEIDTWSPREEDFNAHNLLDGLKSIIGSLEVRMGYDTNELLRLVFDRQLCNRANEEVRGRGFKRSQFFESLSDLHRDNSSSEERMRDAIRAGLDDFRTLFMSNFHREFDQVELRKAAVSSVFNDVDDLDGADNGERCREWLEAWAAVDSDSGPSPVEALARDSVAELLDKVVSDPFRRVDSSREPFVFQLATAAARGLKPAQQALLDLVVGPRARANMLFGSASSDAVGRSLAFMIAQVGSKELFHRLFGDARPFQLPFDASIDGVTPLMAAVRSAPDGSVGHASVVDAVINCDPSALIRRDRRGWRTIHHAFAAGRVDIARKLAARDPSCLHHLKDDSTTFLIEAFACAPVDASGAVIHTSNVVDCAMELLRGMPDSDERIKILAFRGLDSLDGMPRSLVSAVVSSNQHWQQFMSLNEVYAAHAHQIWDNVGSAILRRLIDEPDSLQLGPVLRYLRGVRGDLLTQMVADITHPPVALRIAEKVKSAALLHSAGFKFNDLRAVDQLKITDTSPDSGGTMFHSLLEVKNVRKGKDFDIKNSELYALVIRVIASADPADAKKAINHLDFELESAIRKASRVGEAALALAFARAMGWPVSLAGQEERWREASCVLIDPNLYQHGIPPSLRIGINAQNQLTVPFPGVPDPVVVSSSPLPRDIESRSACDWLKLNASEIASNLGKALDPSGPGVQVGLHDFVNWMAHLSKEP